MENMNRQNNYTKLEKRLGTIIFIIIMVMVILTALSGCTLTTYAVDPIYEDHPHTTEVYWYTDHEVGGSPYFGYWSGFYYYYGIPHYYPWWYYYQFIPPHHYYTHTHIHVHCDNGHYVYGHRGPTINNNVVKDFTPTIKIKNNKDKSFVFPKNWKSNNSTRINKQNNIKYNTNKLNYNRIFNSNQSNKPNNTNNSNRPNRSNKKTKR
jgi:hypothetical protein